ncbi:unnamed protein product [Rotaria sordida]|uniref:UBA domain-containing protein n=1 Tax=Rotaria sordida TaxID=392033 RepID=A0A813PWN0_9BILA|nr:unnamed protein product [Rotaria sordida]CAF0900547.1 unnamed protein product [Rotaria sordida]
MSYFFCLLLNNSSNSTSACSSSSSSSTNDMLTMEDHIQSLISMGFLDRDLNRRALIKAHNDISEAVTMLTSSVYYNDDILIPTEAMVSTFIGPLTEEQLERQQQQTVPSNNNNNNNNNNNSNGSHSVSSDEYSINNFNSFTTNAFLDLETKVYGDNWSIPYKRMYDFILS